MSQEAQQAFVEFRRTGDPSALGRVFDLVAQELLLVAAHVSPEPSEAEDLVQQTFLDAIESAATYDAQRPLLPWLVGILVNRARRAHARRRRRIDHERLGQRDVEDPFALAGANELLETVQRALERLPPRYRLVLDLRLVRGLQPIEIAHTTGLSPETVKTQLRRGLDILRRALPPGFAALTMGWLVPGRGLAAAREALLNGVPATRTGVAGTAGASARQSQVLGGAMVALVAVATIAVLWCGGAPAVVPPVTTAAVTRVASATPGDGRSLDVPRRGEVAAVAPSRAAAWLATVRGRLVAPDGTPAAGLTVTVLGIEPLTAIAVPPHAHAEPRAAPCVRTWSARSAADGTFAIGGIEPRAFLVLRVSDGRLDLARRMDRALACGEVTDLGDVLLRHGGRVRGRVTDEQGLPVAGAYVRAMQTHGDSTRRGTAFSALPLDAARADALVVWQDRHGRTHAAATPAWLRELYALLEPPAACTGADGTFEIGGLAPGGTFLLASRAGTGTGGAVHNQPRDGGGEAHDAGTLTLRPRRTVHGRVVDAAGMPVAGVEVRAGTATWGRALHLLDARGTSDGDGRFTIADVRSGDVWLAVAGASGGWIVSGPHRGDVVDVRLAPARKLRVRVLDARGLPCPTAALSLHQGDGGGESLALGLLPRVRPAWRRHGDLLVAPVAPGVYTLLASADGHALARTTVQVDDDDTGTPVETTIGLPPAAPLEVLVHDANGVAVPAARVHVLLASTPEWLASLLPPAVGLPHWPRLPLAVGVTDDSGRATFANLPPVEVDVLVAHALYAPATLRATLPVAPDAGDEHRDDAGLLPASTLRVELGACGSLDGLLSSEGAPPSCDFVLELRPTPDAAVPELERLLRPDANGRFQADHLPPGEYELRRRPAPPPASLLGIAYAHSGSPELSAECRRVVVAPGRCTRVALDLRPGVASPGEPSLLVHGRVMVEGAAGPAASNDDFEVHVHTDEWFTVPSTQARRTPVSADGSWRLDDVRWPQRSGHVGLSLVRRSDGARLHAVTLPVTAGTVVLEWSPRTVLATLAGVVRGEDGVPRDCRVRLSGLAENGGYATVETHTDSTGAFRTTLPVGSYAVQLIGRREVAAAPDVTVRPGGNEVRLEAQRSVPCTGRVDLRHVAGGADPNVTIVLERVPSLRGYRPMAVAGADGTFQFQGVLAGDYEAYVHCAGRWYRHPEVVRLRPPAHTGTAAPAAPLVLVPVPSSPPPAPGPLPREAR